MSKFIGLLVACALAALVTGCGGGDSSVTPLDSVQIVSGDGQSGVVSTELSQALVVRLLNAAGSPLAGKTVNFAIAGGGGRVSSGAVTSDADGYARERWTLGPVASEQAVDVRSLDSNGTLAVYATFTARALPGPAAAIVKLTGDDQAVAQHQMLAAPLTVMVKDALGNAAIGVPVEFSSASPGVYVTSASVSTDAAGKASWAGYIHAVGSVLIRAGIAAPASVNFTVLVTAAGHDFDGTYILTNEITRTDGANPSNSVTIEITDAIVSTRTLVFPGGLQIGTFQASTGTLSFDLKPCSNECSPDTFAGTLMLDPSGQVSGSGTIYQALDDKWASAGPVGKWTAKRQ